MVNLLTGLLLGLTLAEAVFLMGQRSQHEVFSVAAMQLVQVLWLFVLAYAPRD